MNQLLKKTSFSFLCAVLLPTGLNAAQVKLERVPEGGIQPQIAMGADGTVHLLFFKGDPRGGNVFYTSRRAGQEKFSPSIQVNSQPNAAIAIGTMRGPQLALGKGDRVHVTWMGGEGAPKARVGGKEVTGFFHARMKDDRNSFEPERNVITYAAHLDGGGTVAADKHGNVYLFWHGSRLDEEGEQNRAVYLARSADEGRTFSKEQPALKEKTGSCACCGMRALVNGQGDMYVLFRAALSATDRPQMLFVSNDQGSSFRMVNSSPWEISTCPASTAAFFAHSGQTLAVWESEERVYWSNLTPGGKPKEIPAGDKPGQRHPFIATNEEGAVLVVWAEGTGWQKGGSVGWRLFDKTGKALGQPQKKEGVPVWSFAAAYPEKNGSFTVLY